MIGRANRFHGYGGLRYVYRNGRVVRGPVLSMRISKNPRRSAYRLAVVVSKKVHKSAVVRNRIRRRIYELFRIHQDKINGPYDIVCTVFSESVATMENQPLEAMILEQLAQYEKQTRLTNKK